MRMSMVNLVGAAMLLASLTNAGEVTLQISPSADPVGAVAELIAAVQQAGVAQEETQITLAPGTYIFQQASFRSEDGPCALPVISGNQLLVLRGDDTTIERASGAAPFRFLDIAERADVFVTGVTFRRGRAEVQTRPLADCGGAILNRGRLTLHTVTAEGNSSTLSGGFLRNLAEGELVVENCRFVGNAADAFGGAIDNVGTIPGVLGSHFEKNHAGQGGGAYAAWGTSIFRECTFPENTAGVDGGAIRELRSGQIQNCEFKRNEAAAGVGGAISLQCPRALLSVADSYFEGNRSKLNGGAVDVRAATAVIAGSKFIDNESAQSGGAIGSSGSTQVGTSTFVGNKAGKDGGALLSHGRMIVLSCQIKNNAAVARGGGISDSNYRADNPARTLTISASVLAENTSAIAPAIFTGEEGSSVISKSKVLDNRALEGGSPIVGQISTDFETEVVEAR
ncbi:hypothetical protein GC173_10425 [bacterium]|nr:hypothetical protein [bacterium]